jgi:hypothetical protein
VTHSGDNDLFFLALKEGIDGGSVLGENLFKSTTTTKH